MALPNPIDHRWFEQDGSLAIKWRTLKPAPESAFEFVRCACTETECQTNHCSCYTVNIALTIYDIAKPAKTLHT